MGINGGNQLLFYGIDDFIFGLGVILLAGNRGKT